MASPQYYLFALYAKLDELALDGPDVAAKVEGYLPGTTGPGQQGWSKDIEALIRRLSKDVTEPLTEPLSESLSESLTASRVPPKLPSVDQALQTLLYPNAQPARGLASEESLGEDAQPMDSEMPPALTVSQRARLTYVVGALLHLPIETSDQTHQLIDEALSLAAPANRTQSLAMGLDKGATLKQILEERFHDRDDFRPALDEAARAGLVSDDVKEIGPICAGYVQQIGTEECAIICSNIRSSTVTLEKVMEIVDPLNWDKCLPEFFCEMKPLPKKEDEPGFFRVLEMVSVDCGWNTIDTALKYWKGEIRDEANKLIAAYVNYDLDGHRKEAGDCDDVVVDNGTIYLTRDGEGVRVHSTKHAHLKGLSVTAMAMFMCIFGWNQIGEHMLFASAKGKDSAKGWVPFEPVSEESKGVVMEELAPTVPTMPKEVRKELVGEPIEMLASWIEDAHEMAWGFASQWLAGEVEPRDYISFSEKYAGRMASEPLRYLARAGRRARRRPPSPEQRRGGVS